LAQEKNASTVGAAPRFHRAIVFTGHMIDAPDRPKPRFPPDKETVAGKAIRDALAALANREPERCIGFAGGASGGDLLFHEACQSLGIESRLRLAMPVDAFIEHSVAPADADWEQRFHKLVARQKDTLKILNASDPLPAWVTPKEDLNVWARTNIWLLQEALSSGAPEVHLLALWNGDAGDGPGGTGHLIELARQQGVSTDILDTKKLFGL
jgi:hypothetical protein